MSPHVRLPSPAQYVHPGQTPTPLCRSEHERERVLKVSLERSQPPRADSAIDRTMIARKSDLHDVDGLEAALFLGSGDERGLCGADGEDAGLRGVDDCREVGDVEHAEVGDGEGATLFIFNVQNVVSWRIES